MILDKPHVGQLLESIRHLSLQEQLNLLQALAALLHDSVSAYPTRSILELEGLGAEIWRGIDPQEYVNQERASWDG